MKTNPLHEEKREAFDVECNRLALIDKAERVIKSDSRYRDYIVDSVMFDCVKFRPQGSFLSITVHPDGSITH